MEDGVDLERLRLLFRRALAKNSASLLFKYGQKLGKQLRKEKHYQEAKDVLQTTLTKQIETFGEDHAQSASTMVALGDVFEANGEYAKAMHYFNKALPIQEAHLGKEHSAPTKTALKLASIQSHQEEYYSKALDAFREALQIKIQNVGEFHPSTANTFVNLGLVCKQKGDLGDALEHFTHAMSIRSQILGKDHPETAAAITHVAEIYRLEGNYSNALEYYKWSQRILASQADVQQHPLGVCLFNIALILQHLRRYQSSFHTFYQAAQHFEQALGANHPETLDCIQQAERVRVLAGKHGDSEAAAETSI